MSKSNFLKPRSALLLGLGLSLLPACGGSQPPPAAPPPAAPPPAAAAPAAPAPASAPAPAATAAVEIPAPAPVKHRHGHDIAGLFMASLASLELKPEQKTVVEGIESDLDKLADAWKEPREKLGLDVADGVAAGKIDHKKTDADIKALSTAVAATEPSVQDAMDRLHKTLDADQRKKLVLTLRDKGTEIHEHMAAGEHEHAHDGKSEHEHEHAHDGKAEHDHAHEGKGPGAAEHEHEHEREHEGPLAKLTDELALTPQQKEKLHVKIEAQMQANHAAMKGKWEAAHQHLEAIGVAFEGEKFDAKKAGVGAQAPDMVKAMASERVQFAETILGVLTPEQRAKFAAHVKEHAHELGEGDG